MILSPAGLRPEQDYAGEAQQQHEITDPSSRPRRRYRITNLQLSKENFKDREKLGTGPEGGLIPRRTCRLTVGRNVTLTLTWVTLK
jgi:hypothetical protein